MTSSTTVNVPVAKLFDLHMIIRRVTKNYRCHTPRAALADTGLPGSLPVPHRGNLVLTEFLSSALLSYPNVSNPDTAYERYTRYVLGSLEDDRREKTCIKMRLYDKYVFVMYR